MLLIQKFSKQTFYHSEHYFIDTGITLRLLTYPCNCDGRWKFSTIQDAHWLSIPRNSKEKPRKKINHSNYNYISTSYSFFTEKCSLSHCLPVGLFHTLVQSLRQDLRQERLLFLRSQRTLWYRRCPYHHYCPLYRCLCIHLKCVQHSLWDFLYPMLSRFMPKLSL